MCRVTMGHLRVTIGYLRVTIGHLRVTIYVGHLKVIIGHPRVVLTRNRHSTNTKSITSCRATREFVKINISCLFLSILSYWYHVSV